MVGEWIKWNGGECPVHANTLVDIEYSCGNIAKEIRAGDIDWHQVRGNFDVVEYRISRRQSSMEEAYEDADRPISDGYVAGALNEQVSGTHYLQFEIQPVEFINANRLDFLAGNVVKYISRHKLKGGADDVKKAIHYCKLILELQYGEDK